MNDQDKFAREKRLAMEAARKGISSNIPLKNVQKKYLKNLLYFSMMNAAGNETVTQRNFIRLVNRLFKKYLVKLVVHNSDTDDDDAEEGLEVELNNILANEQRLNLQELQTLMTPENIIALIKNHTKGVSQRQILNHLLSLRDLKTNHRETPEEQREREERQKEYELQRKMQRAMEMMNVHIRDGHSRS